MLHQSSDILSVPQYPGQHWEYVMTDEEYDESGHVLEPFQGHCRFEVEEAVQ